METKFYATIREYYDYIFPLNNKQVEFVKGYFIDEKSKLLEVGCANGKLTNFNKDDLKSKSIPLIISGKK